MRSTVTTTAIPASIQPFIWFKNEKALNTFVFTSSANAMTDAPITPHAPEMTTLLRILAAAESAMQSTMP